MVLGNSGQAVVERACDVLEVYEREFHGDTEALLAVMATIATRKATAGPPVWVKIVAAPSAGKGLLLEPFSEGPGVLRLSSLTRAAILSGDESGGADLARKLDRRVLILPELGAQTTARAQDPTGVLRDAFDGHVGGAYGTFAGVKKAKGRITIVAACTPSYDAKSSLLTELGERFLAVRLHPSEYADYRAMNVRRSKLASAGRAFLCALRDARDTPDGVDIPDELEAEIYKLARALTWLRTSIPRDPHTHQELGIVAEIEPPHRCAQQLAGLYRGLRFITGMDGMGVVRRVALDTAPAGKLGIVRCLDSMGGASINKLEEAFILGRASITRSVRDLLHVGVLVRKPLVRSSRNKVNNRGGRPALKYSLSEEWKRMGFFSASCSACCGKKLGKAENDDGGMGPPSDPPRRIDDDGFPRSGG